MWLYLLTVAVGALGLVMAIKAFIRHDMKRLMGDGLPPERRAEVHRIRKTIEAFKQIVDDKHRLMFDSDDHPDVSALAQWLNIFCGGPSRGLNIEVTPTNRPAFHVVVRIGEQTFRETVEAAVDSSSLGGMVRVLNRALKCADSPKRLAYIYDGNNDWVVFVTASQLRELKAAGMNGRG